MAKRLVTGELRKADDSPMVGAKVAFHLIPGSYDSQVIRPSDIAIATTDINGQFQIYLWPNIGFIPSYYLCRLPDNSIFRFLVPDGTDAISLAYLRELADGGTTTTTTIAPTTTTSTTTAQPTTTTSSSTTTTAAPTTTTTTAAPTTTTSSTTTVPTTTTTTVAPTTTTTTTTTSTTTTAAPTTTTSTTTVAPTTSTTTTQATTTSTTIAPTTTTTTTTAPTTTTSTTTAGTTTTTTAPSGFDTTIVGPGPTQQPAGVGNVTWSSNSTESFRYNNIANLTGQPVTMQVQYLGTVYGSATYLSGYGGQTFGFTMAGSTTVLTGTFASSSSIVDVA